MLLELSIEVLAEINLTLDLSFTTQSLETANEYLVEINKANNIAKINVILLIFNTLFIKKSCYNIELLKIKRIYII